MHNISSSSYQSIFLITDEVKKVDHKVVKNTSDILSTKTSLTHNKSVIDDLEREVSFFRGKDY